MSRFHALSHFRAGQRHRRLSLDYGTIVSSRNKKRAGKCLPRPHLLSHRSCLLAMGKQACALNCGLSTVNRLCYCPLPLPSAYCRDAAGQPRELLTVNCDCKLTQYIPPPMPPPGGIGCFSSFSGISLTSASVVSMSEAMEAAFWSAVRATLVGSMTPASTRSP